MRAIKGKMSANPKTIPAALNCRDEPSIGPPTDARKSTGVIDRSFVRRNGHPRGRIKQSPATTRTGSATPSTTSQHCPKTSA